MSFLKNKSPEKMPSKTITTKTTKSLLKQLMSISSDYITAMVKEGEGDQTSKLNLRILLYYSYGAVLGLRFLLASIALNLDDQTFFPALFSRSHYFTLDPLCGLFLAMGILDRLLSVVVWPGPLFILFLDYLVSFSHGFRIYLLSYDLIVLNREDFSLLNPHLFNDGWRGALRLFRYLKEEEEEENIAERVKFRWRHLPHFSTATSTPLSASIRFRAVALATALDLLVGLTVLSLAVLCPPVLYLGLVTSVWNEEGYLSAGKKVVIALEEGLILYTLWHSIKISLFFALSVFNLLFWFLIARQKENNRELKRLLVFSNNSSSSSKRSVNHQVQQLSAYLPRYLQRHFTFLSELLTINRQIVSPTLVLIMATMMPFNVYGLTVAMLSRSLQLFQRLTILFIVFVQIAGSMISLWPLISAHEAVYSPVLQLLSRSMAVLGKSGSISSSSPSSSSFSSSSSSSAEQYQHFHLRWKLSTYYEVLTTGERFSFTVGPLGKVTSGALFEFAFIYVIYLIFCIKLFLRN